jgi:hypothetical protein
MIQGYKIFIREGQQYPEYVNIADQCEEKATLHPFEINNYVLNTTSCTVPIMLLYSEFKLVGSQSINAQILTVNRAGFSLPAQGAGANMPERTSLPASNVRTVRSSNSQQIDINWVTDNASGDLRVVSTRVFIQTSNGNYQDVSSRCGSNYHTAQTCSIPMNILGQSPYFLNRGDGIYAKITSTNAISRTSEAIGNGAIYTNCQNGAPDAPKNLMEMVGFKTSRSLNVQWTSGDCDGNSAIQRYTVYYREVGG